MKANVMKELTGKLQDAFICKNICYMSFTGSILLTVAHYLYY